MSDQDDILNQWLTQQMGQLPGGIPPSAGPSPAPAVGASSSAPAPDIVPRETSTAMPGSRDPEGKIADSHPGIQTDQLTPYLQNQEQQVDKFGPDKQAALMQHLQQGYKSPGNLLAKGGATLADAIMQGVARAGSSGNLAAINENENKNLDRAAETGKSLNEQNLQGIQTKMGINAMSPTSALGSANEPAIKAVASMYKMKPEQIQALMKSNPQTALKLLDQVGQFASGQLKSEIEQQMKLLEIQVQQSNAEAMHGIAQEGKDIEKEKATEETLKEAASHPILHPIQAWRANKEIGKQAGVDSGGGQESGPLGETTTRNGKTYIWSPTTKQYHPAQQ